MDEDRHPMELPPEYDPEWARERIRERIAEFSWDAGEGHIQPGDTFEITEPAVLTPDPLDEEDVAWELKYKGDMVASVAGPDDVVRGKVGLDQDNPEEALNALGEIAAEYHESQQLQKADERLQEPGDSVLLDRNGKLTLREDGQVAVEGPEYTVRRVVEEEDLDMDLLDEVFEEWRDEIREKYEDTDVNFP